MVDVEQAGKGNGTEGKPQASIAAGPILALHPHNQVGHHLGVRASIVCVCVCVYVCACVCCLEKKRQPKQH